MQNKEISIYILSFFKENYIIHTVLHLGFYSNIPGHYFLIVTRDSLFSPYFFYILSEYLTNMSDKISKCDI